MTQPELSLLPTTDTEEHDCAYRDRLERYRRNMGGRGLASVIVIERVIEDMHTQGICPPTHIGTGPTREWEEILDYTRM